MTNSTEETIDCPVCRDETFTSRDFMLEHLQIHHSPAEVYVAVME